MNEPRFKIELAAPGFFAAPMKRVVTECIEETGRTYFLLDGKIIGVAKCVKPEDHKR